MDTNIDLPAATATDPSDVVLALETAHALWRNGDSKDALKWLRRAAETAEAEGDDMRALSLARAAAELSDLFPMQPSEPPAAEPAEPPPVAHPPTMPAPAAPVSTPVAAAAAASGSNSPSPVSSRPLPSHQMRALEPGPTPISSLAAASRPPPLPIETPPLEDAMPPAAAAFESAAVASAPARPFDGPLPPSFAARGEAPPSAPPSGFGSPHAAPVSPAFGSPLKSSPSSPFAAAMPVEASAPMAAPPATESPSLASSARQTLRVVVEVLSRGSGTFLVRILDEGDSPPSRGHEALLVPLVPGVDLREG